MPYDVATNMYYNNTVDNRSLSEFLQRATLF